jgi:hypothetical protein
MNIKELADEAAKYSAIMALPTGQSGNELFVKKLAELVAAHEREECAKLCDGLADMHEKMNQWGQYKTAETLAQAIRARSKA